MTQNTNTTKAVESGGEGSHEEVHRITLEVDDDWASVLEQVVSDADNCRLVDHESKTGTGVYCQKCGSELEETLIDGSRCKEHMHVYAEGVCPLCLGEVFAATGDAEAGCLRHGVFRRDELPRPQNRTTEETA